MVANRSLAVYQHFGFKTSILLSMQASQHAAIAYAYLNLATIEWSRGVCKGVGVWGCVCVCHNWCQVLYTGNRSLKVKCPSDFNAFLVQWLGPSCIKANMKYNHLSMLFTPLNLPKASVCHQLNMSVYCWSGVQGTSLICSVWKYIQEQGRIQDLQKEEARCRNWGKLADTAQNRLNLHDLAVKGGGADWISPYLDLPRRNFNISGFAKKKKKKIIAKSLQNPKYLFFFHQQKYTKGFGHDWHRLILCETCVSANWHFLKISYHLLEKCCKTLKIKYLQKYVDTTCSSSLV